MNIEVISLIGLAVTIILGSVRTDLNIGLFSVSIAYIIGVYFAGFELTVISSFFPSELFLMLLGITLLIYISKENKTLDILADISLLISHGHPNILPIFFFFASFILSAVGAGNIAATALVAPFAMGIAHRTGINMLMMIILVCTGANAGTFSPIAATGVINLGLINKIGIYDKELPIRIFIWTAMIQSCSAAAAYIIFRGYKLQKKTKQHHIKDNKPVIKLNVKQIITLVSVIILFISVTIFNIPVGLGAFVISSILFLLKAADQKLVIKALPWNILLLVCGIMVLIGVVEKTGGLNMATTLIAGYASPKLLYSTISLVSSLVSIYSSSSGVVMPTFISMLPGLLQKVGSGDIVKMVIAVDIGSHMVDVSPLSTLGALCLASVSDTVDKTKLFRGLLIWGFAMALFGAILIYVIFDIT